MLTLTRDESLRKLADGPLDVLVVGGGIVGAGVARDAAMRGLRVGLVERNDFAFGTSSRSSRLLHGGLRYLAQGRIGLVREASVEKLVLHRIAPHLAMPLPFVFPSRRGTPWNWWKLRAGVKVYDLLCGGENLGKSSGMNAREVLSALPGLSDDHLTGAVRYFDGMTNDARLVLDTLRSASDHGAILCNYAPLRATERSTDGTWRCKVHDTLGDARLDVTAKCVVNAAGAWADTFAASRVKLRLTKGVHLVIDRSRLPINDAVVMAEGTRILFAIPWGERVILGTTDTDYDGPVDAPTCDAADVRYILGVTNATFPAAKLTPTDVISSWAGLRPLIASGNDDTGKPSDVSRAHDISMTEPGWFDVAGGKLTTYRLMAEQTIDRVVERISASVKRCATAHTPLVTNGAVRFSGILPPAVSREPVEHFCRGEWAARLDDVMIRRTSWHYYHRDREAIAERVARWMAELLGWDDAKLDEELRHYRTARCGAVDPAAPAGKELERVH